jgi:hypothetical protein
VLRHLEIPPRDAPPIQIVTGSGAEGPVAGRVRLASAATETAAGVMPDLRGSTLRQALTALTPRGVRVEIAGRGRVVQQTPAPGELLADDAVARLMLSRSVGRVAQRSAEPGREAVP